MVLAMWLDTLQHARTDGKSPGASCLPITVVRFARTSSVRARDLRSALGPPGGTGLQGRQPHDRGLSLGLILDDQGRSSKCQRMDRHVANASGRTRTTRMEPKSMGSAAGRPSRCVPSRSAGLGKSFAGRPVARQQPLERRAKGLLTGPIEPSSARPSPGIPLALRAVRKRGCRPPMPSRWRPSMAKRFQCHTCWRTAAEPGICCGASMSKPNLDEGIIWPLIWLEPRGGHS